jgi:pimeloyl-ACP methyl ester carboxylesterase
MAVFALVHGGWHGGWCWDLVAAELTARGHTCLAPDLPTTDPAAGAAGYARTVLDALPERDDVVLVAHSLAGLVAPLVAAAAPVRRIAYVAAMLPEPGRSVDGRARAGERMTRRGIGRGQTAGADGSTSWRPEAAVELLYPDSPPRRAAAAAARLRPQHWRITAEPSPLAAWPDVPATYVLCREDRIIDADWARAAAPAHAELVELPGDHSPFLARPAALAGLLADLP